MKEKPRHEDLIVEPGLKAQLEEAAAGLGLDPQVFLAFALKREISIFSKGGPELLKKIMACTECQQKVAARKSLLVTIDLTQFEQPVIDRLSGEAVRKGVSLELELTHSLLAWFGYIAGDDAVLKTINCPGCGCEIKLPTSVEE